MVLERQLMAMEAFFENLLSISRPIFTASCNISFRDYTVGEAFVLEGGTCFFSAIASILDLK